MQNTKSSVLWLISLLVSTVFLGVIYYKWNHVNRVSRFERVVIHNPAQLDQFIQNEYAAKSGDKGKSPLYTIPTGFFIQSLAFISPSDVNVTGYIWQKYPEDFPEDIPKGFIFPEEVNSGDTTLRQMYTHTGRQAGKTYRTIGWYFDVTLRQSFDYSYYPLDLLTVWLRLWPKKFEHDDRILFVPDFSAYADAGKEKFGLDEEIVQGEWEIKSTTFGYANIEYDVDFGLFERVKQHDYNHDYNEFFINLKINREFINAFIINLVPLMVVALLLFAELMTVTGSSRLMERFGFNTSGSLASCSALFFVVLLAHIQVRQQSSGTNLVYIEYFYLIMYVMILATALNAYLFSLGRLKHMDFIHYRDNLVPKILFWPITLGLMALFTWIKL